MEGRVRTSGPGGDSSRGEQGPAGEPRPAPHEPDGGVAVRIPARRRGRHGVGPVEDPGQRHPGRDRRRRAREQLRVVRHAAARRGGRHQRLRRGHVRAVGVGPQTPGRQRQRRRPRERPQSQGAPRRSLEVRRRLRDEQPAADGSRRPRHLVALRLRGHRTERRRSEGIRNSSRQQVPRRHAQDAGQGTAIHRAHLVGQSGSAADRRGLAIH